VISGLLRYRLWVTNYEIDVGAWYIGAERRASRGLRGGASRSRSRSSRSVAVIVSVVATSLRPANWARRFQRAYMAFAVDSSAELSIPELESVSLEWRRPVERRS